MRPFEGHIIHDMTQAHYHEPIQNRSPFHRIIDRGALGAFVPGDQNHSPTNNKRLLRTERSQ